MLFSQLVSLKGTYTNKAAQVAKGQSGCDAFVPSSHGARTVPLSCAAVFMDVDCRTSALILKNTYAEASL